MEKQTHTEVLSRKLSDRVKIQTTYQGRPDKDEEAPLDDVSSRFVRGSLASPESRASLRSAHRGITEPAVQQRLRARWIPGDWWRRPSFFSPHHAAASQRALASKQETGAGQHPPSDPCTTNRVRAAMRIQAVRG